MGECGKLILPLALVIQLRFGGPTPDAEVVSCRSLSLPAACDMVEGVKSKGKEREEGRGNREEGKGNKEEGRGYISLLDKGQIVV